MGMTLARAGLACLVICLSAGGLAPAHAQQPRTCFPDQPADNVFNRPPNVRCPTQAELARVMRLLNESMDAKRASDRERNLAASQEAIAILTATYGPDHAALGIFYCSITATYTSLARFEEAKRNFDRGFALVYQTYGPNAPETGNCIHTGANFYQFLAVAAAGNKQLQARYFKEAENAYRAALRIFGEAQPRSQYEMVEASVANHFADTLELAGRPEEARIVRSRAQEIEQRRLGRR